MARSDLRAVFKTAVGLVLLVNMQGCAQINEFTKTKTGAAVWCSAESLLTGGGAFLGCNLLTKEKGVCTGVAIAAALADGLYCWWIRNEKRISDYEQTKKALHYDPSQGQIVKILEFSATPNVVRPGEEVKIRAQYALMSPHPTDEIEFERKITPPGGGKPNIQITTYQPGTWGPEGELITKIDPQIPEGKYLINLEIKLTNQSKQDSRTLCFTVTTQSEKPDLCAAGKSAQGVGRMFVVSKVKRAAYVRAEPKNTAKIVDRVQRGDKFPVLDTYYKQGSILWYKIQLKNGREGWLSATTGTLQKE
jgi:hypothetical protein